MVYCSALDPFDFDADPGSTLEKMNPDLGHFFKIYWFFVRFFFTYFHSKTWWPIQKSGISLFSIVQIWGLRVKKSFSLQFLADIMPLGSWYVDLYIFADPDLDPGSQNLADPTNPDPDPYHCFIAIILNALLIPFDDNVICN